MAKTVILGDEFDDDLKSRLFEKLKEMGANPVSSDWGIAGSQEIDSLSIRVYDQIIEIESETFVGLSISGPEEIVDEIASLVIA
jgi:hypothetical protein